MRKVITFTACGVLLFLGAACEPMEQYNPQSNSSEARTFENCSQAVYKVGGYNWSEETGVPKDELRVYNQKVKDCMEPTVIHEDDPNWDCKTMGNKKCGKD